MAENSEEIGRMEKKMEAMKKVYAEVILNTSKEAAFRVMLSDRKAVQFHRDLVSLKDDYALLLLRLRTHFHSQIQEAEARSLNQQKKIDELEAQLGEAEGIIVDLRDEIKHLHQKLETMTGNMNMLSKGFIAERKEPVHECLPQHDALGSIASRVSDATADLVGAASPRPTSLNYQPSDVTDNYGFPGKSNLKGTFAVDEDISSYIMQNTEADQRRNGYSQRIRAFERSSLPVKLPTLKASESRSIVNVLVETGEAKLRNSRLVQSVEKPYPICPSETNEKNLSAIEGYNKDQIIGTRRRSAGKNARYREAIASLRGKPRKKYVKSWKPPLRGQLKACSSRLNVQSVKNPTEAAQTLLESNSCCAKVPDNLSARSDVKNRCYDILPDGELDHVVCSERADEEEASEGLKKKMRLTVFDGLLGSELFDVPISEGSGSLHKQVHHKGRKNILRKVNENTVHEKCPMERKMEKLTDVSVMASDVLYNDMNGELEMVNR